MANQKKIAPNSQNKKTLTTMWYCEELFTVDNLSLEKIAEKTEIPMKALEEWSVKLNWTLKKEKLAEAKYEIKKNKILTRASLLKKLLDEQDPQTAMAVSRLETLALKEEEAERKYQSSKTQQKSGEGLSDESVEKFKKFFET